MDLLNDYIKDSLRSLTSRIDRLTDIANEEGKAIVRFEAEFQAIKKVVEELNTKIEGHYGKCPLNKDEIKKQIKEELPQILPIILDEEFIRRMKVVKSFIWLFWVTFLANIGSIIYHFIFNN